MDLSIRIDIIRNSKELRLNGHDKPVLEIYNDISYIWISEKNVSFKEIEKEIRNIKRTTGSYLKNNYTKKVNYTNGGLNVRL